MSRFLQTTQSRLLLGVTIATGAVMLAVIYQVSSWATLLLIALNYILMCMLMARPTKLRSPEGGYRYSPENLLADYKFALDQSSIVALTDKAGRIIYANDKFANLSKYSIQELVGKNHSLLKSGHHQRNFYQDLWQTIARGQVWRGEVKNKAKDGSFYWVDTTIVPFMDKKGRPYQYLSIRTDITSRVNMQESIDKELKQRQHKQKLEAIGTMTSGIAHDFNNILHGLKMGLTVLKVDQDSREDKQRLENAVDRGRKLIQQILTFSRKSPLKLETIDLRKVLQETSQILKSTCPENVQLEINCSEDRASASIEADTTQLFQVILNLCNNGFQAMKKSGGTLKVTQHCLEGEGTVEIRVQDQGTGISKENQAKIFEPFFTTKAPGEGTGMGLAVVHGIIESHNGEIQVESELGKGTTFILRFKQAAPLREKSAVEGPTTTHRLFSGRLLLVDDDLMIQKFGAKLFEDFGFQVAVAASVDEALGIFQGQESQFQLIVTDFRMPKKSGVELVKSIRPHWDLPIILSTGDSNLQLPDNLKEIGVSKIIHKPFSKEELKEALTEILQKQTS